MPSRFPPRCRARAEGRQPQTVAMTKKLMIGGYAGAGKSTLCLLLDGHPQLRVTTNERFDRVLTSGATQIRDGRAANTNRRHQLQVQFRLQMDDGIHTVYFVTFRNLLNVHSFLNIIEAEALVGEKESRSSTGTVNTVKVDFDFERFQRLWKKRLFGTDQIFTREQVLDTLYDCFFTSFRDMNWPENENTINVFCLAYDLAPVEMALSDGFDAKFIFMRRPREDFYAGLVQRTAERDDCKTLLDAEGMIRRQLPRHLNQSVDDRIDALAARRPESFLILDISDVAVDYEKTMPRVAKFLDIEMDEILLRPTFHGRNLPYGEEYLGKVNDADRAHIVSPLSRAIFELQYHDASIWEALRSGNLRAGLEYSRLQLKRSRWGHRLPI